MTEKIPLPEDLVSYPATASYKLTGRSVGDVISNVFPNGPHPALDENGVPLFDKGQEIDWNACPVIAPDLFAATSHLLEVSGAFSYYNASDSPLDGDIPVHLFISPEQVKKAVIIGDNWAQMDVDQIAPQEVIEKWNKLVSYWNWPINARAYQATRCVPSWWDDAYFLFIIADEASKHVGFPVAIPDGDRLNRTLSNYIEFKDAEVVRQNLHGSERRLLSNNFPSMCRFADPDVVCIQPKSLVSNVGGGTRVFSHHLANLRPRGLVRTQWASTTYSAKADDTNGLNLLLVPLPYDLSKDNFFPVPPKGKRKRADAMRKWRTFKLKQNWLRTFDPATHILKLIEAAKEEGQDIHGVVLPELALDAGSYQSLSDKLADETGVEFLISGCLHDCNNNEGNYVWCSRYNRNPDIIKGAETVFIQSKHHRWKLEENQIKRYKISSKLAPKFDWWEHVNVGGRELNFASFRANSIFATIICEDLARSEPCHEILRSVGPNLLFALLMDGPQIEERWSSRYSSYLSEDPGIGVLTLTSKGLIRLSNPDELECCVAHFRDASGKNTPITCPRGSDAVVMRLEACPNEVEAIDGRKKNIVNWQLVDDLPQIPLYI